MVQWTPDFFRQTYGEVVVELKRPRGGTCREMTVRQYFDDVHNSPVKGEAWYLADWQIRGPIDGLRRDYTVPEPFRCWSEALPDGQRPALRWMYIGPAGSGKPLHVDVMATAAWNAVINGKKRWRFYPPDHTQVLEIVQRPGDLVYTPSGWWHQVENLEAGISVTENFVNELDVEPVMVALGAHGETRWLELLSAFRARLQASPSPRSIVPGE